MPTASYSQPKRAARELARSDLRDMLLAGGAGQFVADMSIPYMNFLPTTCDPYAQGVIQIVKCLQRLLNKQGACLIVDGGMGIQTLTALEKYSGPRWYEKSWAQLYADVIDGEPWRGFERIDRGMSPWVQANDNLGGFVGDVMASPLPWIGLGALVYYMAKHRRGR